MINGHALFVHVYYNNLLLLCMVLMYKKVASDLGLSSVFWDSGFLSQDLS